MNEKITLQDLDQAKISRDIKIKNPKLNPIIIIWSDTYE